jgi:Flp pilus assembly protein TadD
MTVDRDRADAKGVRLPSPVFRPWPPRRATLPPPTVAPIRPCFVRPPPSLMPAAAQLAASEAAAGAPIPGAADHPAPEPRRNGPARAPRFARFAAALQSTGGALGPAPVPPGAGPWDDAVARAVVRPPAGLPEAGGARSMPGGHEPLAAIERGLRRLAVRRSTVLIGAASAAALALVGLFEPTGGQDRTQRVGPPAETGSLVRAPPTADRYRPAAGLGNPSLPSPLLVADRPPSSSVAVDRPRPGTLEPARQATSLGLVPAGDAAAPEKAEPPGDPAPAPVSLARLSAAVAPPPPRIEDAVDGVAADGKFAALAVRTGALTEPAPEDDDPLYDLAHRLQQKGDVAQAIEAYRMAADVNPQHASTWYDWGYLLQQQGDERGARDKYRMTLRFAPRHAFAHYNLGYILQKHGDYTQAIQHYRAAIAADPHFYWSWYNLGYIRQKQGQYRAALADYRKSIEVDPKHALSYENIATILRYHRTD